MALKPTVQSDFEREIAERRKENRILQEGREVFKKRPPSSSR